MYNFLDNIKRYLSNTQLLQHIANRFAMDDWNVPIMLFPLSLSHTGAV